MNCLGIDPSVHNVGIAFIENGKLKISTTIPITEFSNWFQIFSLKYSDIDTLYVSIERPPTYGRAISTIAAVNAIKDTIKKYWNNKIRFVEVVPQAWRKAVLGNGRAGKKEAERWVELTYHKVDTHHEAEAVCIAQFGYNEAKIRRGK